MKQAAPAATALLKKAAPAAIIVGQAALVIAAGLAAYYATTWVLNQVHRTRAEDKADLDLAAANAYREARRELVVKLNAGSWEAVPTAAKAELANQFKAKLAQNAAFMQLRRDASKQNISDYQTQLGR